MKQRATNRRRIPEQARERTGSAAVSAVEIPDSGGKAAGTPTLDAAGAALADPGHSLPHAARIQSAFGHHDVGGLVAHDGGGARQANQRLGSRGFAVDGHVALGAGADLHTVAHEAAHEVQRVGGVRGNTPGRAGDAWERHADEVVDAVVAGGSAEALLDRVSPAGGDPSGNGGGDDVRLDTGPPAEVEEAEVVEADEPIMEADPGAAESVGVEDGGRGAKGRRPTRRRW